MFRLIVLLVALGAIVNSLPTPNQAKIIEYESTNDGTGTYHFKFKSEDGTAREESGIVVNEGKENEAISVVGSYEYIDPKGELQRVNYVADDEGYHVEEGPRKVSTGVGGFNPPVLEAAISSAAIASLAGGGLG